MTERLASRTLARVPKIGEIGPALGSFPEVFRRRPQAASPAGACRAASAVVAVRTGAVEVQRRSAAPPRLAPGQRRVPVRPPLHPAQRRRAGQRNVTPHRRAQRQVVPQRMVVQVLLPQRQRVHPLAQHLQHPVTAARLPARIPQTPGHRLRQPDLPVHLRQQLDAAVPGDLPAV